MRWTIPPPSEWVILGRPAGEWVYLALMTAQGVNSIVQSLGNSTGTVAERGVMIGQMLIGGSAIGVVVCTILGYRLGMRLLWLFAASVCGTVALVMWALVNAPVVDVLTPTLGAAVVCAVVVWYGRRRLRAAITRRRWAEVVADHAAAADEFVGTIEHLTAEQWTRRLSAEAWSPAEITDHLARTYSQYAGESRGKNSLRVRLRWPQLLLARAFVKPRLLRGAPFPKARAPRTLRPSAGPTTPADGVALFKATGAACVRDLTILAERRPYRQLVHPYLGPLPLYDMVTFAAQHVRHHHRQLLGIVAAVPQE